MRSQRADSVVHDAVRGDRLRAFSGKLRTVSRDGGWLQWPASPRGNSTVRLLTVPEVGNLLLLGLRFHEYE